jgi:PD-(D/E)XK nuclease superfamily protein
MQLTEPQQRTLDQLIGTERPVFPADLPQRLRDRIEEAARGLELDDPLWLGKERLNDLDRCEGTFWAKLAGEGPPFAHSRATAVGVVQHRAIEVVVGARDALEPHDAASIAATRTADREERFAEYWRDLGTAEQDDLLMEVARRTTLFEGSFPPLRDLRRELALMVELPMKAELLGGSLVVSGKVDLVIGRPDRMQPMRAQRLLIDLKTGGAYPEHAEDNRAYALLHTLRFGVPPYRVASFFLEGGTWQVEDVHEEQLFHAAERVIAAARSAAALRGGREPGLNPGRWCSWCPRLEVCPSADPGPFGPSVLN